VPVRFFTSWSCWWKILKQWPSSHWTDRYPASRRRSKSYPDHTECHTFGLLEQSGFYWEDFPFDIRYNFLKIKFPRKTLWWNPRDTSLLSWMASLVNSLVCISKPHLGEFEMGTCWNETNQMPNNPFWLSCRMLGESAFSLDLLWGLYSQSPSILGTLQRMSSGFASVQSLHCVWWWQGHLFSLFLLYFYFIFSYDADVELGPCASYGFPPLLHLDPTHSFFFSCIFLFLSSFYYLGVF